jgi:starch-binding outer membrane protein SusE/F
MNKILKSFLIIGLGLGIFTACDDDRDSNPTLISPTEFVLNTPAISGTVIDLANSSSIEISCSQPDYGFPANVGYYVQVAFETGAVTAHVLTSSANSSLRMMPPNCQATTCM